MATDKATIVYTITAPDGEDYDITAPADATEAEVLEYAKQQFNAGPVESPPPEPPPLDAKMKALRAAEFASRGFLDSAAETAGAIPELVATGFRKVGLPAPEEGYYPQAIKKGLSIFGKIISAPLNAAVDFGNPEPQSTLETGAYGTGRGLADAGSFMLPGAAAAKFAKAGTMPARVGAAMASQPGMQAVGGGVTGGVSEATGSDVWGISAGLLASLGPGGMKRLGNKVLTPFPSQLSANEKRLAASAEKMGIKLTPGQKSGSPGLRTMESTFGQLPLTAKTQGDIYDTQRKLFNKAVLEKAGVNADEASPEVMDKAFKSIGKEFDDLAERTIVKADDELFDEISRVANDYGRRLSTDIAPVFKSYTDDLNTMKSALLGKPEIAGKEFQRISSDIKRQARSSGSKPDLQRALYKLAGTLDNALERSGGPALKSAWKDVRNRYRNLLTIDTAVGAGTQADRTAANIPLSGLRNAVKAADKAGYGRGRGDLNEASRVGDFLGAAIPPDSGTARRGLMTGLLTGGAGAGGGYMAAGGDPATAAMIAAGTLAAPKAAQMAYQTPLAQAYLRNQLANTLGKRSPGLAAKVILGQQLGGMTDQERTGR